MKTTDYTTPNLTVLTMITEGILAGSVTNGTVTPNIAPLEREEGSLNF